MVARARYAGFGLLTALTVISAAPAQPLPPKELDRAGEVDGRIRMSVTRARQIALRKLKSAQCRGIFQEFQDLDGHWLDEDLAAGGETAEERLARITFVDGIRTGACRKPGVYAFTSPFSRTVFICPAFDVMSRTDTRGTANVLIHEELHSLGAGEAPAPGLPSSREISARVERRCGS